MVVNLSSLSTETRNKSTLKIDELPIVDVLKLINQEDMKVAKAVRKEIEVIAKVIEKSSESIKTGGRIIYIGAGTSGRLGVLDAVECPPTFGVSPETVTAVLAGGSELYNVAGEGAEDSAEYGMQDIRSLNLDTKDIVIGITASGRTPYVIGAIEFAKTVGVFTVGICCNKNTEIRNHADLTIEIENGPEALTGSTRLKAGTSQKMVLNMISTVSMIRAGKVYNNLMIDVEPSNLKLVERWKNIVMVSTGCSYEEATDIFDISGQNAKTAIVMIEKKCSKDEAQQLLLLNNGFVKNALNA